jgi:hypothetical protein
MGQGLLNISDSVGTSPNWALTVDTVGSLVSGDFVACSVDSAPVGTSALYRVTSVPNPTTIAVVDDLKFGGGTYGKPGIGAGQFFTPTVNYKLQQLANKGPYWAEALRRDCQILDSKVKELEDASGVIAPVGHDGYALIEVSGVVALRPIKQSYIVQPFSVQSLSSPSGQEVGQTLVSPSFTASYNRTPTAASIQDNQGNPALDVIATPTAFSYLHSYTKTANNVSVQWTLSALEGLDPSSAQASTSWRPRIFYGVGIAGLSTEADIEALAVSQLASGRQITFTVAPGPSQYIYYAYPTSYGAGTFFVGGFEGGFGLVSDTISVTNAFGVTQNYSLYKSTNANLGSTTVQVT